MLEGLFSDRFPSGRSAAWLARLLGVQEVVGSNPAGPTILLASLFCGSFWVLTSFNRRVEFSLFIARLVTTSFAVVTWRVQILLPVWYSEPPTEKPRVAALLCPAQPWVNALSFSANSRFVY